MIPVEQFTFAIDIKDEYAYLDLGYVIGVGDNKFTSCISKWSNSQTSIREQLETYVTQGDSRIEICFKDSPTEIFMNRSIAMDSEENQIRLRIVPNEFLKNQIPIIGYCNERQVIQRLYAGLLFGMTTHFDEIGWGYNWSDCKMVRYNRMKSYIVESYLAGSDSIPDFRNAIKHILVYTGKDFIRICDESAGYHVPIDDTMIIHGKDGSVLCTICGIKTELEADKESALTHLAQMLPSDFDLWDISDQNKEILVPVQYYKKVVSDTGCHFSDENIKINEYGCDPYGFTTENLQHACNYRDMDMIRRSVEAGADIEHAISWVLSTYAAGSSPYRSSSDPEPLDAELEAWDKEKVRIVSYLLNCGANPGGFENHPTANLKECIWCFCPDCMALLLKRGADPNAVDDDQYNGSTEVKFRSVLSLLNYYLEKKEHTDILLRMKASLEAYNARDFVIYNEKKKDE